MGAPLPEEKRRQVEEMLREGLSDLEIHRRTGVSRDTSARYRRRLGLPGFRVTAGSPACRHGHPFPENVARDSNGWLYCRACSQIRSRGRAARSYQPVQPDEMAVERAVAGDPPERLTPRERAAAVRQLDAWCLGTQVISARVGCHERTVYRIRRKNREAV